MPKTKGSKASVPVIGPLRQILDEYKVMRCRGCFPARLANRFAFSC
jgi:hypothetical protein